ncbi:hypothetical protein QO206_13220 [Leeuwenhoekiella aequorea]|uniref:hypothetical protein n=1 Tax=Leeuwenhoekiella aequorea TaxID=283736 RepID=UPI00352F0805|tara:strand:+ start:10392 stop:10736 length:345 start_codon:yes stop_codon:yes gene_type:complete
MFKYSELEVKILQENYQKLSNIEISKLINRTPTSISKKLKHLNLNRTPEHIKAIIQKAIKPTQFKKGIPQINRKKISDSLRLRWSIARTLNDMDIKRNWYRGSHRAGVNSPYKK